MYAPIEPITHQLASHYAVCSTYYKLLRKGSEGPNYVYWTNEISQSFPSMSALNIHLSRASAQITSLSLEVIFIVNHQCLIPSPPSLPHMLQTQRFKMATEGATAVRPSSTRRKMTVVPPPARRWCSERGRREGATWKHYWQHWPQYALSAQQPRHLHHALSNDTQCEGWGWVIYDLANYYTRLKFSRWLYQ